MTRHLGARQLLPGLLRPGSVASPSILPISAGRFDARAHQGRSYATILVPKIKKEKREIFRLQGVPLRSFEEVVERNEGVFTRVPPARYYQCAVKFTEAILNGSWPYSTRLDGDGGFSAATLHETACIMRHVEEASNRDAISIAMWASASEMGYEASTISLARQLIRTRLWGQRPQMKNAETKFKQIVSKGRDPNALTAEGELLFSQGKYDAALKVFQRALQLDSPAFEWKSVCQLSLGMSHLKLGEKAKAREMLEGLLGSGLVDAEMELGQLLRTSDEDLAAQHLYTAGLNDRPEGFTHLAEIAFRKADKAADKASRDEHRRWAMEWSRLANPKVEN